MSLRDQYAREAMSGILANSSCNPWYSDPESDIRRAVSEAKQIARVAYFVADAMLEERERTNKSKAQKEMEK